MNTRLAFSASVLLLLISGCAGPTEPVAKNNALYSLKLISQTITPGWAMDVSVVNDTAYVACNEQGVMVYDVRNQSSPVLFDTIPIDGKAIAVGYSPASDLLIVLKDGISNGLVVHSRETERYLGSIGSGLAADFSMIELSADSVIIGEVEADFDDAYQVKLWYWSPEFGGGWAQRAGNFSHANGANGWLYGLCLDSSLVYFANGEFGIRIGSSDYRVLGDNCFSPISHMDTPGSARKIALNGDRTHLYVADWQAGLQVVDVTDKSAPRITGGLIPAGVNEVQDVKAYGDTAFFTDKYNGLFAADVRNPANPKLIAIFDTPDPQGFCITSDGTIFLTDQELGLLILKFR